MATVDPQRAVEAAVPTLSQITDPEVGPTGLTRVHVVRPDGQEIGRYLINDAGAFVGGSVTDKYSMVHPAMSVEGLCTLLMFQEAMR